MDGVLDAATGLLYGLIYGPGSKHGHRLTHVLAHGFPDATKRSPRRLE